MGMNTAEFVHTAPVDGWGPIDPRTLSSVTVHPQPGHESLRTQRRHRPGLVRRTLRDTGYVLAVFPLALVAVPVIWAFFGVGLGLSFIVVGLPLLAFCANIGRAFAVTRRRLIRATLNQLAPSPVYHHSERGPLRRALTTLADPQSWLDIVHAMFGFITATISFSVLAVWWTAALSGITWILWSWSLPDGEGNRSLPDLMGLSGDYLNQLAFYTALGVLFLLTLPFVARAAVWLDAGPALLLLSGRAALQQEIEYQVQGKEAARTAESGSLRRLERDIHDGPQQRLVRLGMDLGRAKRQLGDDPERALRTIDEAIAQTRDTLDELRSLSRGIAPPVLADRGLQAALEEVIARSVVPVHLTIDAPPKLPDHVETAVYFVISEALTNIAKHARADYVVVTIEMLDRTLRLSISDNGLGGATLAKGHGLVGLSDRIRGVDGIMNLSSPIGGPTELAAEIPCAS